MNAVNPDVISVAIIEDDRATRDGLGMLVDDAPGFRCGRRASTSNEAARPLEVRGRREGARSRLVG